MKKTALFLILILILTAVLFTVGCTPAKLEKITGIYRITTKTSQHVDSAEVVDLVARDEITEYIVLTGSDKGFYLYGDKNTTLTCKEVKIEYDRKSDDSDKISYVKIYTDITENSYTLGLHVDYRRFDGCYLVSNTVGIHSSIAPSLQYTKKTEFSRVSKEITLSALNKEVGKNLSAVPYELTGIHGLNNLIVDAPSSLYEDDYYYRVYDIDVLQKKAVFAYAKTSDGKRQTETLSVNYELKKTGDNAYGTLTIGEEVYTLDSHYNPYREFTITDDEYPVTATAHLTRIDGNIDSYTDVEFENSSEEE